MTEKEHLQLLKQIDRYFNSVPIKLLSVYIFLCLALLVYFSIGLGSPDSVYPVSMEVMFTVVQYYNHTPTSNTVVLYSRPITLSMEVMFTVVQYYNHTQTNNTVVLYSRPITLSMEFMFTVVQYYNHTPTNNTVVLYSRPIIVFLSTTYVILEVMITVVQYYNHNPTHNTNQSQYYY